MKKFEAEYVVLLQIAALGGMAVIVAQPSNGLSQITTASAEKFASVIQGYEEQGASMLIEFGHEMNGNWYAWGQQPAEYIKAFQTVSTAIAKVGVEPMTMHFVAHLLVHLLSATISKVGWGIMIVCMGTAAI